MRIYIAEENKRIANFIKKGLEASGFQADTVDNSVDLLLATQSESFDMAIVDAQLENGKGLEIVRKIRAKKSLQPIMLLSSAGDVQDVVAGLDAGADAYMKKPIDFSELLARVEALLRRAKQERGAVINFADLALDPVLRRVWRDGREIELTAKEFELLEFLVRNPNMTLTRQMIAESVWDFPFDKFTNIIDVYINYLRKKVDKGFPSRLIHTVRAKGYMFSDAPVMHSAS